VLVLLSGVDVHPNRFEAEIVGFGMNEETWGIRYDRFMGNPEIPADWDALDQWLLQEFDHPSGVKLRVAGCCIDTGHKPKAVYNFVRSRPGRRIWATKGSSVPGSPLVARPKKSGVRSVDLFMVGTDTGKGMVYSRLKLGPGPCHMHFPNGYGYGLEYFQGLTAERLVTEYLRGFPRRVWKKIPDNARNEPLDIRVCCLAARDILNPNFHALAKNLAKPKETVQGDAALEKLIDDASGKSTSERPGEPANRRPARPIRRGGWVKGWKGF
jgi:phage terminase large subunit GpA-like protein